MGAPGAPTGAVDDVMDAPSAPTGAVHDVMGALGAPTGAVHDVMGALGAPGGAEQRREGNAQENPAPPTPITAGKAYKTLGE
eukprot:gene10519-biopygen3800